MNIPSVEQLRLPILKIMGDNKERHTSEIFDYLDKEFQFSDEDKAQQLATGVSKLKNLQAWAIGDLKAANLIEKLEKSRYKITEQGQEVLRENPSVISDEFLRKNKESTDDVRDSDKTQDLSQTPLKLIKQKYQSLKAGLAIELLEYIKNQTPDFFEKLAVDLLIAMGYGKVGEAIGKSHDGGIDGIIKENELGFNNIYIQAKRYDSGSIGEGAIRNFVGALVAKHAQKGIFITTASYSNSAREYAKRVPHSVILIDGNDLVGFIIKNFEQ